MVTQPEVVWLLQCHSLHDAFSTAAKYLVAKFVYECMEFRRSEECEDYNPYFDLSLFGDEWQGRIFDTFSSGPRGDIAETFTSDGPGSSISAHGA